jgi:hypothetical protein
LHREAAGLKKIDMALAARELREQDEVQAALPVDLLSVLYAESTIIDAFRDVVQRMKLDMRYGAGRRDV